MDKEDKKPKTFVSTFTLALKPKNRSWSVEKQENTHAASDTLMINSRLGVSSAPGARPIPAPSQKPHHFPKAIGDCKISEGSNASFQAVIAGSRSRNISCLHNGEKVLSTESPLRDVAARLTRTRCSPGDAGNGSGSAQLHVTTAKAAKEIRSAGRDRVHAEVTLKATSSKREGAEADRVPRDFTKDGPQTEVCADKGPPVEFVDPSDQVEVRVGEQARLRCEFRSSCVPVACCWIYNRDKVVVGGPRRSVHSGETQSSVEISQAFAEDTGSYTVIARNRQGSAQHTVSLSVIDRPEPPASQPVVSQLSSRSLVLSWTGPSYDGGTAVFGYVVEVRQEGQDGSGNWTEITNLCKSTSYHVRSGLEPQGRYRFRVRAYNSAGVSEPSQESDCVKMETTKEKKDDLETYVTVSVDTEHKIKDHYHVHEQLGVGKFGKVFRLSHKDTDQVCAGKFYRAKTSKEKSAARKEIELMTFLHHPKLVQCLAAYDTRWELVMVMEYIAGGELFERIAHEDFEHTEPTSARYMQQILEGMQYVHKQNIVHLDLKPENIVCVDTTGTQIKIIDFGLASKLEKDKPLLVMHGTPEFVAPEVINYEPVGLETDMWSIGVICFILLSGESPFQGNSDAETFAHVTAARYEFDQESFEDISDEAKDFITSLLKRDQRCRLSCTEALAHPWMVSFTPLTRRPTKSLRKEKMRRFLAKRKWKKTGKAVLALQRMANLSSRPDSPGSSSEEPGWSQEAEEAIQSLDKQLRSEPRFQQALRDAVLPKGASARLTCRVDGYPPPAVKWLHNETPLLESSTVNAELHDDGLCSLVLTDLEPSHSGVYVCRASNELGEAMCSAKLRVEL